jgi:tetratricopeptide (TPR) repeat protein
MVAGLIFYIFFKQIFSGDYPKRGVDFDSESHSTSSRNSYKSGTDRLEELISIADKSIKENNYLEAQKALMSASIISPNNPDILRRIGVTHMNMSSFLEAKKVYRELIEIEPDDDLAHSSLANALHKLGENEEAIKHHKISIELDSDYAPNYFNYANTLYDLKMLDKASELYKKAYELDHNLRDAKKMIDRLDGSIHQKGV